MESNFESIIKNIIIIDEVQKLKDYKHHYGTTRFEHCISVSYYSYIICKFFHLDYVSATRAGLLHDLFLYDCESKKTRPKNHIRSHPKIALENAKKILNLNNKECDIILKHMWPITITPPKYLEGYIITFVDKFCAFREFCSFCKNSLQYWCFIYFCTYKMNPPY